MIDVGCDFKAAGQGTAEIFVPGTEIPQMVKQNMSLLKCIQIMRKQYRLGPVALTHEAGHIIMAALKSTHPVLMEGREYQGNDWAECYTISMQQGMEKACSDPMYNFYKGEEKFQAETIETSENFKIVENYKKILSWLIAQERGVPSSTVLWFHHYDVEELKKAAKEYDIIIQADDFARLKIISPKYGTFEIDAGWKDIGLYYNSAEPGHTILPPQLEGTEPLILFDVLSKEETAEFYTALLPAIHYMQKKIYDYRALHHAGQIIDEDVICDDEAFFDSIHIGDIVDVLRQENFEFALDNPDINGAVA